MNGWGSPRAAAAADFTGPAVAEVADFTGPAVAEVAGSTGPAVAVAEVAGSAEVTGSAGPTGPPRKALVLEASWQMASGKQLLLHLSAYS